MLIIGQEKYISPEVQQKLDSLDVKIKRLEEFVTANTANRDAKYFYNKRELGLIRFVKKYEELIYDEDLDEAQTLIDAYTKAAQKNYDEYAVNYFNNYKTKLTNYRIEKQKHYQQLFTKEKTFKKEYDKYIESINEYSLIRSGRMIDLAINYAKGNNRTETLKYLYKYKNYNEALKIDLNSSFDLEELTGSISKFEKEFNLMLESDSLKILQDASKLLEECITYSHLALTEVDSNYYKRQRNVAANAIADWNTRQGMNVNISTLTGGAAVIAHYDSINKEGIFKWNNLIVVIGNVNFDSNSEMVRRGQAISAADRTLFNYIRLNRISDLKPKDQVAGTTFILPYNNQGKKQYYKFDVAKNSFQYMVCYKSVINEKVTEDVSKYLPPLQFKD